MAVSRETKKLLSVWLHAANQRLLGIIFITFWAIFFLGPPFFPWIYWGVTLTVLICLCSNALRLSIGLIVTSIQVRRYLRINWAEKGKEVDTLPRPKGEIPLKLDLIRHVIVIPNYKEEYETLCETLDTLANHATAKSMYKIVMAMEEGEKECREKAEKLLALFQDKFFAMYYTVHPSGLYGEARGKSSNVAWATTQYAKNHMVPEENRFEIFTIVDADTHLTQKYFECITFKYCRANSEEQTRILFAPVLVFDRNANKVPFVVRLADICWSIGLIGNFQMPVKFPCSVYSVSMLLAQHVNFWDAGPEAIGEDMHMSIKCLTRTRMKLKLTPIYIPASCSNVQGNSYMKSIKARFQQSKRHLWGSLDFGYLVSSLITRRCWTANPLKCFLAIYFLFEIFFQPFFGVYHLSGQYIFPASTVIPLGDIVVVYGTYIRYGLMLPAVVVGLAYEWYHYQACRYRSEILKKVSNRKRIDANSESVLNGVTVATDNENGMTINAVASGYGESDVGFRAWYQILDWLGLPFCLIFYYVFPGVCAMLGQLFTNRMDYKVSLKPTTRYAIDENITDANGQAVQAVNERPRNSSVVSQSDNNIAMDNIDSHGMVNIVVEAKHAAMRGHVPRDSGVEMDINEDDLEATRVRYHTVTSN